MPARQPSARSQSFLPPEWQVASSNSTVKTFIGGRQPSWMVNTHPVKPTPRPSTPRSNQPQQPQSQSQQQAAQPIPSSVLPSPAPSDEPSPAVSTSVYSPNPNPASLPEGQDMGQPTGPPNSVALPVTEARFVHALTLDNPLPASANAHTPQEMDAPSPRGTGVGIRSPPVSAPSQPQPVRTRSLPQPLPPHTTAPMQVTRAAMNQPSTAPNFEGTRGIDSSSNVVRSSTTTSNQPMANNGPPSKRRRTEQKGTNAMDFSQYSIIIESWITSCGGPQSFSQDIEWPRMLLLREACKMSDSFFLALHQLFCIWSRDRNEAYRYLAHPPGILDAGFTVIEQILKKNDLLSPANSFWFANLPAPLPQLLQKSPQYSSMVDSVGSFLLRVSFNFSSLTQATLRRRYPYLVEELLVELHCFSRVLQVVLFTASRRRLGVPDGPLGVTIDQAFLDDQSNHLTATGTFPPFLLQVEPDQFEQRNTTLIQYFRHVMNQAYQLYQGRSPGQGPLASPTPQSATTLGLSMSPRPQAQGQHSGSHPGTPTLPSNSVPPRRPTLHAVAGPGPGSGQFPTSPYMNGPPQQPTHQQGAGVPRGQVATQPTGHHAMAQQPQSPGYVNFPSYQITQQTQNTGVVAGGMLEQYEQMHQRLQVCSSQPFSTNPVTGPPTPRLGRAVSHGQALPYPSQLSVTPPGTAAPAAAPTSAGHTPTFPNGIVLLQQQLARQSYMQQNTQNVQQNTPNVQQHTPNVQHVQQVPNVRQRQTQPVGPDQFVAPKRGYIPRHEWPADPQDRKSILMSLHQAQVRSPKRTVRTTDSDGPAERYYQAVKSLPVPPTAVPPVNRLYKLNFAVTGEQCALTSTSRRKPEERLPVTEHFNGSLRWRLRCCFSRSKSASIPEHAWVSMETNWPPHISVKLNNRVIEIRRHMQNGKDLPAELTPYIVPGTNDLRIAVADAKQPTNGQFIVAVELVQTLSHSEVLAYVERHGFTSPERTLGIIKSRLSGKADDDGILLVDKELSIDLADPFTSVMFKIPARGIACTHMECFDLETWLNTRPAKAPAKCPHGRVQCNCPKPSEPSNPDKWKCPICFKDARPYSLRVDGFLLEARQQLERQGKLHAKSMLVAADGTWTATVEDEVDDNTDDDEPRSAPAAAKSGSLPAPPVSRNQNVEVIELLDDD